MGRSKKKNQSKRYSQNNAISKYIKIKRYNILSHFFFESFSSLPRQSLIDSNDKANVCHDQKLQMTSRVLSNFKTKLSRGVLNYPSPLNHHEGILYS